MCGNCGCDIPRSGHDGTTHECTCHEIEQVTEKCPNDGVKAFHPRVVKCKDCNAVWHRDV